MKRHSYIKGDAFWTRYKGMCEREFWPLAAELDRLWRNWPCGACGLWKRAKVHR